MQETKDAVPQYASEFGMTGEEVKNYQIKSFWGKLTYYFLRIEPMLVRIFNTIAYWTIKFVKSFISSAVRMVLGKEA